MNLDSQSAGGSRFQKSATFHGGRVRGGRRGRIGRLCLLSLASAAKSTCKEQLDDHRPQAENQAPSRRELEHVDHRELARPEQRVPQTIDPLHYPPGIAGDFATRRFAGRWFVHGESSRWGKLGFDIDHSRGNARAIQADIAQFSYSIRLTGLLYQPRQNHVGKRKQVGRDVQAHAQAVQPIAADTQQIDQGHDSQDKQRQHLRNGGNPLDHD